MANPPPQEFPPSGSPPASAPAASHIVRPAAIPPAQGEGQILLKLALLVVVCLLVATTSQSQSRYETLVKNAENAFADQFNQWISIKQHEVSATGGRTPHDIAQWAIVKQAERRLELAVESQE